MELRFLHGDFGNMKYKLQYNDYMTGTWRDIPVVEDAPTKPLKEPEMHRNCKCERCIDASLGKYSLAERLHRARHMNSGLSIEAAKINWSQHSTASQIKVWGGVAEECRKWAIDVVCDVLYARCKCKCEDVDCEWCKLEEQMISRLKQSN